MDPIVTASLITAGAGLAGGLLGNSSSNKQARKNRNEMKRQFDVQQARLDRYDIGVPWHHLGNNVKEQYFDQTQRGLDMERESQNQQLRDQYQMGQSIGLTPQEFMGSPVPGGNVSSGTANVLGNMASAQNQSAAQAQTDMAMQQQQMQWQSQENAADRALKYAELGQEAGSTLGNVYTAMSGQKNQMEIAELQAAVNEQVAQIGAAAQTYSATQLANAQVVSAQIAANQDYLELMNQVRVDDQRVIKIAAEAGLILQDADFKAVLHEERHLIRALGLTPEQAGYLAAAVQNNVDIETLVQNPDVPENQKRNYRKFLQRMSAQKSLVYQNTVGAAEAAKNAPVDTLLPPQPR